MMPQFAAYYKVPVGIFTLPESSRIRFRSGVALSDRDGGMPVYNRPADMGMRQVGIEYDFHTQQLVHPVQIPDFRQLALEFTKVLAIQIQYIGSETVFSFVFMGKLVDEAQHDFSPGNVPGKYPYQV
jgi:hypothetical protein